MYQDKLMTNSSHPRRKSPTFTISDNTEHVSLGAFLGYYVVVSASLASTHQYS